MKAIVSSGLLIAVVCGIAEHSIAQVVPDNTLGTQVTQSGVVFDINNGTRSGNNLFHSFSQFSVPTGGSANFNNVIDVQNIFSRVTGSQLSNIDGILKTQGTANLFLMNPNGIIFGPNAQLELGGSFVGTTANSMVFGTQGQFSTSDSSALPLLTIQPSALEFNHNPQPITVIGDSPGYRENTVSFAPAQLKVPTSQSLILLGGDINLVGSNIGSDRSQVTLSGLATPGTINLSQTNGFWTIRPRPSVLLANISLTQGAVIKSRQGEASRIFLQGNQVTLSDRSRLKVFTSDHTNGGTIEIQASQVNLSHQSFIGSDSFGSGTAGTLRIKAAESVNVDASLISATTYGTALMGALLEINTDRLSVLQGGIIGTSTFNSGNAGSIRIQASDFIKVSGVGNPVSPFLTTPSGIESASFTLPLVRQVLNIPEVPSGNAGDVVINTKDLSVFDQGRINVRSEGSGNAGELKITANTIKLARSGLLSASTKFEGGSVEIQTSMLLLRDRSQILATAAGTGNGGNIQIDAPLIIGLGNSDIAASAIKGRGGNIRITTQSILGLQYRTTLTSENDITASSEFGISGNVQVNMMGINPANALNSLPSEVADSSRQIGDRCGNARASSFVATGRGGIPQDPMRKKGSDRPWHDLRPPTHLSGLVATTVNPTPPLIEASALQIDKLGVIALVAAQPILIQNIATCGVGDV